MESTQAWDYNHTPEILADMKPCLSPSLFSPTAASLLLSIHFISPCPLLITALHCTLFLLPSQPHKSINVFHISPSPLSLQFDQKHSSHKAKRRKKKINLIRAFYSFSTEINLHCSRASQFPSEILSFSTQIGIYYLFPGFQITTWHLGLASK